MPTDLKNLTLYPQTPAARWNDFFWDKQLIDRSHRRCFIDITPAGSPPLSWDVRCNLIS